MRTQYQTVGDGKEEINWEPASDYMRFNKNTLVRRDGLCPLVNNRRDFLYGKDGKYLGCKEIPSQYWQIDKVAIAAASCNPGRILVMQCWRFIMQEEIGSVQRNRR